MADLLRSGNTMLNMACPVCNNPIFRNRDGNTFCPTCNRNVLIVKDDAYESNTIKKSDPYHKEKTNVFHPRKAELLNSLQEITLEKIEIITKKLKNETNSQIIKIYTEILVICLEILSKIQGDEEK